MIATLSSRGQIVIPHAVRERCGLEAGDHLLVEDDPERRVVTLRKVKKGEHWFDVYMQCPDSFKAPPRRKQFARRRNGLAG